MRFFLKKMKKTNNSGSTMVEVLVGFTILVAVLAECSVHLLGAAGNMIVKAKDMQTARQEMNEELYKKNPVSDEDDEDDKVMTVTEITGATVTLELDKEKTSEKNYNKNVDITAVTLAATVKEFSHKTAELTIIHIDKQE